MLYNLEKIIQLTTKYQNPNKRLKTSFHAINIYRFYAFILFFTYCQDFDIYWGGCILQIFSSKEQGILDTILGFSDKIPRVRDIHDSMVSYC